MKKEIKAEILELLQDTKLFVNDVEMENTLDKEYMDMLATARANLTKIETLINQK